MGVGTFNISSMFGMMAVYGIALSAVVYKSFALTYELPNAMLNWMGVNSIHADLGESVVSSRNEAAMAAVGGYLGAGAGLKREPDKKNNQTQQEEVTEDNQNKEKNIKDNSIDQAASGKFFYKKRDLANSNILEHIKFA